jgi:hypothetical protein
MQKMNPLSWLALPESRPPLTCDLFHVCPHALQFRNVRLERFKLLFQQRHHLYAWNAAPIARSEDLGKFGQRKPEPESMTNHVYSFEAPGRIHAVCGRSPRRFGQHSQSLIMTQRIRTYPCRTGQFA